MNNLILIAIFFAFAGLHACSQRPVEQTKAQREKIVGSECEGCEAIHEYGSRQIQSVDTLPDFEENGPKLEIHRTIYHRDGKTPAKDVIFYIYHTNQDGVYATKGMKLDGQNVTAISAAGSKQMRMVNTNFIRCAPVRTPEDKTLHTFIRSSKNLEFRNIGLMNFSSTMTL